MPSTIAVKGPWFMVSLGWMQKSEKPFFSISLCLQAVSKHFAHGERQPATRVAKTVGKVIERDYAGQESNKTFLRKLHFFCFTETMFCFCLEIIETASEHAALGHPASPPGSWWVTEHWIQFFSSFLWRRHRGGFRHSLDDSSQPTKWELRECGCDTGREMERNFQLKHFSRRPLKRS